MLLRVGTPIFQILGVLRRLFWWQVGYGFKFSFCHKDSSLLVFCVKAVNECRYQVNLEWALYKRLHCQIFISLHIYFVCVCILGSCMPLCACEAWRTAYRRQFTLSTMWVMGIDLGSLDVLGGLVSFCFQLDTSLDFCGKGIWETASIKLACKRTSGSILRNECKKMCLLGLVKGGVSIVGAFRVLSACVPCVGLTLV